MLYNSCIELKIETKIFKQKTFKPHKNAAATIIYISESCAYIHSDDWRVAQWIIAIHKLCWADFVIPLWRRVNSITAIFVIPNCIHGENWWWIAEYREIFYRPRFIFGNNNCDYKVIYKVIKWVVVDHSQQLKWRWTKMTITFRVLVLIGN